MKKTRGYDLTIRKLTLDDDRKAVLKTALEETAQTLDPDQAWLYRETAKAVLDSTDRIFLTAGQVNVVRFSLESYEAAHGKTVASNLMLKQLDMTRQQWNDYLLAMAVEQN